ncbi:unnamed protein product, partial [Pylaiella littoralis]
RDVIEIYRERGCRICRLARGESLGGGPEARKVGSTLLGVRWKRETSRINKEGVWCCRESRAWYLGGCWICGCNLVLELAEMALFYRICPRLPSIRAPLPMLYTS